MKKKINTKNLPFNRICEDSLEKKWLKINFSKYLLLLISLKLIFKMRLSENFVITDNTVKILHYI